jgi:peptidoglycan/xylan/chitin deacetylase (PgdA/CDA1 family)
MGTITEFAVSEPLIALTFDDGPDGQTTPRLLELLERHRAKATFFVVGDSAVREAGVIEKLKREGHAVGNHTWSHQSMAMLPRPERRRQVTSCARAIAPCGRRLFRPPWGHQTNASRFDLLLLGYDVIGWNVDVGDWWDPDAHRMAALLESRIKAGSIVLLHDAIRGGDSNTANPRLHPGREPMLAALAMTLERLAGRFSWVTIPQMFKSGRPVRRCWLHGA